MPRGPRRPTRPAAGAAGDVVIYFMTPDEPRPSGGVRFVYAAAEALTAAGFDALVWHGAGNFRCRWFEHRASIVHAAALTLGVGDVLVMPEWGGSRFAGLAKQASVVILAQNHFYVFSDAEPLEDLRGPYPGWSNVVGVIATSEACCDLIARSLSSPLPTYLVPYAIDTELFRPADKQRLIAFMPRKRKNELTAVVQMLRRSPLLAGWRFEQIDGMSESDVAAVMARAAIFLSGSDREGFGLPVAEAMASGCSVVGFTGGGGREFMRPDLCSVIDDQDLVGFVDAVEAVVNAWDSNRAAIDAQTVAARRFICDTYNQRVMTDRMVAAFRCITDPGSPALQSRPTRVVHYSARSRWNSPALRRWIPPVVVDAVKAVQSRTTAR